MTYIIKSSAAHAQCEQMENVNGARTVITPRASIVQVFFAERGVKLAYFNDRFDINNGDTVYVEGSMEGIPGLVLAVCRNFKVKVSDYKRVIAVADTDVNGQFFMTDTDFITFDRQAIPFGKVVTWFKAPQKEDDVFASNTVDEPFKLDDLSGFNASPQIIKRGHEYFCEDKVRYISLDGEIGHAIVEGSRIYEVEFRYANGFISNLVCDCFCCYHCKHEVAAMLRLKKTLSVILEQYLDKYKVSNYFAAIKKLVLFYYSIERKEKGNIYCLP